MRQVPPEMTLEVQVSCLRCAARRLGCHIKCWHQCWYHGRMPTTRKVTVHLPEELLARAQEFSGKGVTETIRDGLRLVAAGDACRELRRLRGKVKFSVSLRRLKEDRA